MSGISTVSATESDAQTLAPNVATTAQNLAVFLTAAPGAGNSITVTLRANGADTALACTVSNASTTCNSGAATAALAAGARVSLEITPSGIGVPAMAVLFGWETG